MDVIPRWTWPQSSAGKKRWKRCAHKWKRYAHQSGADDFRGCALDGPTSLETFSRAVDRLRDPSRAAASDFPAGVRATMDRTAYVTSLTINRLGKHEIDAMIDASSATSISRRDPAGHHRAH